MTMTIVMLMGKGAGGEERITNGQVAVAGGDPNLIWQVALTINGNRQCGGSLIASRYVLTAAHCLRTLLPSDSPPSQTTYNPRSVLVCAGTDKNACSQTAVGEAAWIHASYTIGVPFVQQIDLAVIQLQTPIDSVNNVGPITLATAANCPSCLSTGTPLVVSGFGNQDATNQGSSNPSSVLRYARQQVVDSTTCQSTSPFTIPDTNFCAGPFGSETGTDSCQGDSGGPIAHQLSGGSWVLAGVVSTGTATKTANGPPLCGGAGEYGVYVGVAQNMAFLQTAMSNDTSYAGYVRGGTGVGGDASTGSSLPLGAIIGIAVGGAALLVLIIIALCCCCRSSQQTNHQRNVRKQQHLQSRQNQPVRMAPGTAPPPPISPRGGGAPKTHLPPVRPEYQQQQPPPMAAPPMYGNPAYGNTAAYDPAAMAPAQPAVYRPQAGVVYTPTAPQPQSQPPPAQAYGQYGRM